MEEQLVAAGLEVLAVDVGEKILSWESVAGMDVADTDMAADRAGRIAEEDSAMLPGGHDRDIADDSFRRDYEGAASALEAAHDNGNHFADALDA